MARLNHIEYFKRAPLEFAAEDDSLYAMLQWMTEKIMQLEAEQKGVRRARVQRVLLTMAAIMGSSAVPQEPRQG